MQLSLSGALAGLLKRRDTGGDGLVRQLQVSEVRPDNSMVVRDGSGSATVISSIDTPRQAGVKEWVIKDDKGNWVGLGQG